MGLVCRVVEELGISTVCLSTARDLTLQVIPPRAVFVNFPMGNAFGGPFDTRQQLRVLRACLELADSATRGGALTEMPDRWPTEFRFKPDRSGM